MKQRETVPPPTSAGRERGNERAHRIRGLPFDPHDFTVRTHLPKRLAEITDVAVLNRLRAYDTRDSAASAYDARIAEVQGLIDGASPPKE